MFRAPRHGSATSTPHTHATVGGPARRPLSAVVLLGAVLVSGSGAPNPALSAVRPNPNLERAGVLHDGVLTVALQATQSLWWLNGANRSPMTIDAFSEPGKEPLMPGPLIRVPRGTEVHLSVRNSLPTPLTFFVPAAVRGGPELLAAMDSIIIAPGAVGTLNTRASVPGNYVYRGTTPGGANSLTRLRGLLAGAFVVDTTATTAPTHDRVFVIMGTLDSASTAYLDTVSPAKRRLANLRIVFTINGRSWPNTERIHATVGDSLHWRIIDASFAPHPMHLHGFYYRVDAFSPAMADLYGRPAPGQMVVTQLLPGFSGMSISWSPSQPGNWIFHCHLAPHLHPDSLSAAPDDPYHRDMVGLVLGIEVAGQPRASASTGHELVRHLRLIAVTDSPVVLARAAAGSAGALPPAATAEDSLPTMHFVLEEGGRRVDTHSDLSPELDLTRGEPVRITIVNHLAEPASVHWHGIEVQDSYMDGVPGVSGSGTHLTPQIAPGDSFEARFTSPRAGTFMYHTHVDEENEEAGGMEGALIVRDADAAPDRDDHVFFLKGDGGSRAHPLEIDGRPTPDTVVLHIGHPARFRLMSLARFNANATFLLTARDESSAHAPPVDTMLERWQPLAKDGFDLPAAAHALVPAHQVVSIGETYDFEYVPRAPGVMHLEIWSDPAPMITVRRVLLLKVPIRVE